MRARLIPWAVGALLITTACGRLETDLHELPHPGDPALDTVCAPIGATMDIDEGLELSEVVVLARPTESYFVDRCHRALLLEVQAIYKGILPQPLLAIVPSVPGTRLVPEELTGESALYLLGRDPEVPEAYRVVSDNVGVIGPEAIETFGLEPLLGRPRSP